MTNSFFEGISWQTNKSPRAFNSNLSAFDKALIPKLKATAEALALLGEKFAKEEAPVGETGNLRGAIRGEVENMMGAVVMRLRSPIEYSPYQEFGTIYHDAQPFIRPALEKLAPLVVERTVRAYNDALKSVF